MSPCFGLDLGQLLACFVSGLFAEQTARGARAKHTPRCRRRRRLREWRCADDDSRGADAMLLLSMWARFFFSAEKPSFRIRRRERNCATALRTRSRTLLRGWGDAEEKEMMADTPRNRSVCNHADGMKLGLAANLSLLWSPLTLGISFVSLGIHRRSCIGITKQPRLTYAMRKKKIRRKG